MRAQECRNAPQRLYASDHSQQFVFLFRGKAITGFRLDGGGAVSEKPLHVLCGGIQQGVFGGRSSLTNCGSNAAACRCNFSVGGPAGALLEFVGAIAREYRMRVCVDKSRHHDAVAGIDNRGIFFDQRFDFRPRSYALNAVVFDEHGAIGNNGEIAHFNTGARVMGAGERDELGTTQYDELQPAPPNLANVRP